MFLQMISKIVCHFKGHIVHNALVKRTDVLIMRAGGGFNFPFDGFINIEKGNVSRISLQTKAATGTPV